MDASSLNLTELKRVLRRWVLEPSRMQEILWKTKNPFKVDLLLQALLLAEDLLYQVAEYKAYPMESTYSLLKDELVNDLANYLLEQPLEEILRSLRIFRRLHQDFRERTEAAIKASRQIRKDLFFNNWALEIVFYIEFYPELSKEDQKKVKSYLLMLKSSKSTPSFLKSYIEAQFDAGIISEVDLRLQRDDDDYSMTEDSRLITHLACSLKIIGHENIITMYIFGYSLPLNPLHSLHEQIQLLDTLEMSWNEIGELNVISDQSKKSLQEIAASRVILELDGLLEEYRPEELHVIVEKDVERDWHLYESLPFDPRDLKGMGLGILHYIENEVHERGPPYFLHYAPPSKHLTCPECGGDVVPDIIDPLLSSFLQQERVIEINRLYRDYKNLEILARVIRKKRTRRRMDKSRNRSEIGQNKGFVFERDQIREKKPQPTVYTIADSSASIDLHVESSPPSFKLKIGRVYHLTGLKIRKTNQGWILVTTPWSHATEMPSSLMPTVNSEENMSKIEKRR